MAGIWMNSPGHYNNQKFWFKSPYHLENSPISNGHFIFFSNYFLKIVKFFFYKNKVIFLKKEEPYNFFGSTGKCRFCWKNNYN